MRLFIDDNDITYGVESNIWKAINNSIENNNKETFFVLKSFIRNIIELSIIRQSLKHFQQYIFFPTYYYAISYERKINNNSLNQLHKICSQNALSDLTNIIWNIGYIESNNNNNNNNDIENKKVFNQYYYWAFNSFSQLLYNIVTNKDINQFKLALEEYEQISDNFYSRKYDLKFRIRELQRENIDGNKNYEIKCIKEEISVTSQFETYRRHVLLGIKYWIMFLFKIDKLNEETTLEMIDLIKVTYSNSEDILNDILFFRDSSSHWYMDWRSWDFIERKSLVVYSPPSPHDWLTIGFMADQIRENDFFIILDELNNLELNNVWFLHENLNEYSTYFQDNFDKWKNILKVKNNELLKEKSDKILNIFAILKRKSIGLSEKAIANAPLSQNKIESFKQIVGKAWKSQARINKLFKKIGTTEQIEDKKTILKQIGQRTFFEKAKMMFIEGEYHQMILGVDKLGGEIGKLEDTEFLSTILKSDHNKVIGDSSLNVLVKAIDELKSKGIIPDLILISPQFDSRNKDILKNELFISKLNVPLAKGEIPSFYFGIFDGIPIYSSFSELLRNRVLVCNFKNAFKMRYRTNPNWFENELTINVKEVDNEEAERKYEEQPDKWGRTEDGIALDKKDAITLIKTSIIIDHWSTLDFQILNKDAYIIGYIITETKT